MNDKILITNANVVLGNEIAQNRKVLIENGKIADTNYNGESQNAQIIDAKGGYLFAGFVDIHFHGGGNCDFMDSTTEAFEGAVKAHLSHGTTTMVPTAMSATEENILKFLATYKDFKSTSSFAANTCGVRLEGPYFSGANPKSSGAQPKNILRLPDVDEINRILKFANGDILIWDAAPELDGADIFANTMRENNIVASMGHTAANSYEAQNGIDNGFNHCTHFYNAMTTYHKKDQTVLGGVVEAAYLNDEVTVELICDGKHIPRDVLRLALKIKGDKVIGITDGMRLAATDLKSGKLGNIISGGDVVVDDGVAKLPDLSSFAGSIATMDRCLKVLCVNYGINPTIASKMLSLSPAKRIGAEKEIGSIEDGKLANLVITDGEFNLKTVILKGQIL